MMFLGYSDGFSSLDKDILLLFRFPVSISTMFIFVHVPNRLIIPRAKCRLPQLATYEGSGC